MVVVLGPDVTMFAEAVCAAVAEATVPLAEYLELERASESLLDALAERDRKIALMAPLVGAAMEWRRYQHKDNLRDRLAYMIGRYEIAIAGESSAPHETVNTETRPLVPPPRHPSQAAAQG